MELAYQLKFDFKAKHQENSSVYVSNLVTNGNQIAALGNGFIKFYDIATQKVLESFGTGQKTLSEICFCNNNGNILCTSSLKGDICCYDLRSNNANNNNNNKFNVKNNKILLKIDDENKNDEKPMFSVACDNYIVAGGSMCDIFLWDLRKPNQLYYTIDSMHSNQVSKLKFNPFYQEKDQFLCSASEDGLINQFNLQCIDNNNNKNKTNNNNNNNNNDNNDEIEDLILTNVYSNDGNGIWNFGFFQEKKEYIYSLSTVDSLDIFGVSMYDDNDDLAMDSNNNDENGDLICSFDRPQLNNMLLIDCFYDYSVTKQLYLLSGNEKGKLRMSRLNETKVEPFTEFAYGKYSNPINPNEIRQGGHLGRVRCCLFNDEKRILFTGGEDNSICIWKFDPAKANGTINDENDEKVIAFLNEDNDNDNNDDKKNNNGKQDDADTDKPMIYNSFLDNYKNEQKQRAKQDKAKPHVEKEFNLTGIDWDTMYNGNSTKNDKSDDFQYKPHRGRK